jgi:four helix bundle protein
LGIVEEEANETVYWIELLCDAGIVRLTRVKDLLKEADEILSITVSSIKSAKGLRKA